MTEAVVFAALVVSALVIASLVWLYLVGLTIQQYRRNTNSNADPQR